MMTLKCALLLLTAYIVANNVYWSYTIKIILLLLTLPCAANKLLHRKANNNVIFLSSVKKENEKKIWKINRTMYNKKRE